MFASLLAISWEPGIRGVLVVLVMVVVLIGGTYLIVGTNLGARLGVLVVLAAFFGWMATMGAIWWIYGIGLTGPTPTWQPADPISIVREERFLVSAGILAEPPRTTGDVRADVRAVSEALQAEGWRLLDESDPERGQAVAFSDEIVLNRAQEFAAGEYVSVAVYDKGGERYPKINDAIDFVAFFHQPRYALVELAPLVPQRVEPARAPARPVVDETQPHRYVYMIRDMGARRQPATLITIGSTLVFLVLCWLMHRREMILRENVGAESLPVKA
jgi:hypothetical protein